MPPTSRRVLLGALLSGALVGLTGCGVHLEQDAPKIPLVPTREPIPGEGELIALLAGTTALATDARSVTRLAAFTAPLEAQAAVLDGVLRRAGVPQDLLAAPGTGQAASPSSPARAAVAAAAAGSAEQARALLAVADQAIRPTLASLSAQRTLLAVAAGSKDRPAPAAPAALPDAVALAQLAATRELVYACEVAAAQAQNATRERARESLERARGWVLEQEAALGEQVPPTPTAYALPVRADDNASAAALIKAVASAVVGAYARPLPAVAAQPPALLVLTDRLTAAVLLAHRWGAEATAFPGMR